MSLTIAGNPHTFDIMLETDSTNAVRESSNIDNSYSTTITVTSADIR